MPESGPSAGNATYVGSSGSDLALEQTRDISTNDTWVCSSEFRNRHRCARPKFSCRKTQHRLEGVRGRRRHKHCLLAWPPDFSDNQSRSDLDNLSSPSLVSTQRTGTCGFPVHSKHSFVGRFNHRSLPFVPNLRDPWGPIVHLLLQQAFGLRGRRQAVSEASARPSRAATIFPPLPQS